MLLLGYDVGSSSIKASIVDSNTGATVGVAQHPEQELGMISHQAGWAEQDPAMWWDCICKATQKLLQQTGAKPEDIGAILDPIIEDVEGTLGDVGAIIEGVQETLGGIE